MVGASFDPLDGVPPHRSGEDFRVVAPESGSTMPVLIQLQEEIDGDVLAWLDRLGHRPLRFLPRRALVVAADGDAIEGLRADPRIRWIGVIPSHLKVDPALLDRKVSGPVPVEAQLFPGADAEEVLRAVALASPSSTLVQRRDLDRGPYLRIDSSGQERAAAVAALASDPWVEYVGAWHPHVDHNDHSVYVIQSYDLAAGTSYAQSATIWNRGLLGTGQIVGVADSGFDPDVCFFNLLPGDYTAAQTPVPPDPGTLDPTKKVIGFVAAPGIDPYGGGAHGTHVAGSVLGDNFATLSTPTSHGHDPGDGMAPQARLFMQKRSGYDPYELHEQAFNAGARIHTNSYGTAAASLPAAYDSAALARDEFAWDHEELLILFSQGNALFSTAYVSSPGVAKNVLTVGAATHGSPPTDASSMASFSALGPTRDGRVKPDVAAPGRFVVSAEADETTGNFNCSTDSQSGTSMATPTTAGAAALIRQYYVEGFYPSGAANPTDSLVPSSALLKATMINGADDMGQPNIPGAAEGWGRIHLDNVLHFSGDGKGMRVWDKRHATGLQTGEQDDLQVDVGSGRPFRATLAWTDPPSSMLSGTQLVNDLDLELLAPEGTYRGNHLVEGRSVPGGLPDSVNNVEQLRIENPTAGTHTLRVKGTSVSGNTDPGTDRQGYALVLSFDECAATVGIPSGLTIQDNGASGIQLDWTSEPSATNYEVYRIQGSCSDPIESFTFLGSSATPSYLDALVHGGYAYAYRIRASYGCGLTGYSSCVEAASTANCTLSPAFAGLRQVASDEETASCDLLLDWDPATSRCPLVPGVVYNVYRDSAPGFVPGPGNRIATGLTGTEYRDSAVGSLTTFHYLVRAEDATTQNGGPANGGNEDPNAAVHPAAAWMDLAAPGTFVDDGESGSAFLALEPPWRLSDTNNQTPGGSWSYRNAPDAGFYAPDTCASATTPRLPLGGGAPSLSYSVDHDLQWSFDGVVVEISADDGVSWEALAPVGVLPGGFHGNGALAQSANACGYSLEQPAITGPQQNGTSSGWVRYTHDLSEFAGAEVKIRWVFSSDGSTEYAGIHLDDIEITNASTPRACGTAGTVSLDAGVYACSDVATVTVRDADLIGPATVNVRSLVETSPETFSLSETSPGSGVFEGTISLTGAVPQGGDGAVSVVENDTLTVSYNNDGVGSPASDRAAISCEPLLISDVMALGEDEGGVSIVWRTNRPATSEVLYGSSIPPTLQRSSGTPTSWHRVELAGLDDCRTYFFQVASTDVVGRVAVSDNGGAFHSFATTAAMRPVFQSTDTPLAIPDFDPSGASSVISVSDDRPILDLDLEIDVTHPDYGLQLVLIDPDSGTTGLAFAGLIDFGGGYFDTVFDQGAPLWILTGFPPFTGRFRPQGSLLPLNGRSMAGDWTFNAKELIPIPSTAIQQIDGWKLMPVLPPGWCESHVSVTGRLLVEDSCSGGGPGNGNGAAEPGEQIRFELAVHNDGTTALSASTVTVTPLTPGIAMLDSTATLDALQRFETGYTDAPHLAAQLPTGSGCGGRARFRVDVDDGNGVWSDVVEIVLGEGSTATRTVLFEDFARGIPPEWTVIDGGAAGGGGAATWTADNPGAIDFVWPLFDPAAVADSNSANVSSMDEQLIGPPMDLSDSTGVWLEFDQHFRRSTTATGTVDLRRGPTDPWVTVLANEANADYPESMRIDIGAAVAGAPAAQLRFRYTDTVREWFWAVDNVRVTHYGAASCTPQSCNAPPPVPDGTFGSAMRAARLDSAGSMVSVAWDVATCPSAAYHLIYGSLSQVATHVVDGADCGLGTSGSASWTGVPAGDLWFVVVGGNDAGTEGSWGTDGAGGQRRGESVSGTCGAIARDNTPICP